MNKLKNLAGVMFVLVCAGTLASCAGPSGVGSDRMNDHEAGPPQSRQAAVVALLDRADQAERSGQPQQSAVAIERALRLEPGNPVLWHRLARVHLDQGQYGQAETFAEKSNLLAGDDNSLRARNWRLIADARRAQGRLADAEEAELRAQKFEERGKKGRWFWQ